MAQIQKITPQQAAQQQAAKLQAQNLNARKLVLANAYPMLQSIFAQTIQPQSQQTISVPPQNVGLIRGFLIRLSCTVTNPASGSSTLSLTANGPANLIQNLTFTDLQNYQRINTSGLHLAHLNTARQGRPSYSSTPSDSPIAYGNNMPVIRAPATIAANTSGTIYMYYWVPLAYSDNDLTGSVYANVVNATMNLQLTFAQAAQAIVSNSTDPTFAVYQGAGAVAGVTLTNMNVQVYQSYFDQLPQGQNGPILPSVDLNTMLELKSTSFNALTTGQDNYIPYSNFRHFLSTLAVFDNAANGVYPAYGSDVNYWSFRAANMTDMRKADPYTWGLMTRGKILTDMPQGVYLFDHRSKPIYTTQSGNTALVLNPATVNTGANVYVGWEMLANVSNLLNAASLSSN